MHTPRLCIDARTSRKNYSNLIAEEIVNQLVACQGHPEVTNEWVEKGRTVLLTHPEQIFEGQWRRYNTKMPVGFSPLYWAWERNFVKSASLSLFHKFRQSDRMGLKLPCTTITTVVSPGHIPKSIQWRSNKQMFVVPSMKDKQFMSAEYQVPPERIEVVKPTIRRYCYFTVMPERKTEGQILIVRPGRENYSRKLIRLIQGRFPNQRIKVLSTDSQREFSPQEWTKLISQTLFVVYLVNQPFDWAPAAFELFYWDVPTIFPDAHGPLNEQLPNSPLRLSKFLVEQPSIEDLRRESKNARKKLADQGVFEPLGYAKQFGEIYSRASEYAGNA